MNTSFGAVKDLSEWGTYANEPFYPRHLTSEAVHSQPVSECIIPDTFHTWNLVENVSYESSKCISDMVLKLRLVSYKEELFPELQRSCFYEDDMKIELDTKTIRQLCAITLERKQFAEFVIWFRKYLDCSSRGSKRTFEKEAAFYDIVQLVENLWKPLTVILQENVDHSTNLLSCVFRLERAKLLYEKKEFDAAIQVVSTMLKSFPLENLTVGNYVFLNFLNLLPSLHRISLHPIPMSLLQSKSCCKLTFMLRWLWVRGAMKCIQKVQNPSSKITSVMRRIFV